MAYAVCNFLSDTLEPLRHVSIVAPLCELQMSATVRLTPLKLARPTSNAPRDLTKNLSTLTLH